MTALKTAIAIPLVFLYAAFELAVSALRGPEPELPPNYSGEPPPF